MRKLFTILFALMALTASAHGHKHLKFQGIPITGTFAQFEAQLTAKGWTYDRKASKDYDKNTRIYTGTFEGEHGWLSVSRTPQSKIVYHLSFNTDGVKSKKTANIKMRHLIKATFKIYPHSYESGDFPGLTYLDYDLGMSEHDVYKNDDRTYSASIDFIDITGQQQYFEETDGDL